MAVRPSLAPVPPRSARVALALSPSLSPSSSPWRWTPVRAVSAAAAKRVKSKGAAQTDKRYVLIRDVLFPPRAPLPKTGAPPPSPAEAAAAAAEVAAPAAQPAFVTVRDPLHEQVDTVERAWAHFQDVRARRVAYRVAALTAGMARAVAALKQVDPALYAAATAAGAPAKAPSVITLMPRNLRIPTETPPAAGWK
ncbi:hypothetical protein CXG81DRAFT_24863 [Caulochytrium protostelioides]|uniref:Uncharacterized protein n=1 Tax=Caulochytrium protostelioides TaxID=1555241 RepID=A0A4P9XBH8_9FUNG|nr:hypothetical protein CXG81DRAFT_24863 [Caulochytrium protostelioides]|eukprot:RKP02490.1 hypothetical protein CXG81DRAFT_24863 [Caulochytrium protostelioides]